VLRYTKEAGGRFIVQQHCGHDLLVRTVWCPQVWPLRLQVFDGSNGSLRTADAVVTDVAGDWLLLLLAAAAAAAAAARCRRELDTRLQARAAWRATSPPER
jgi:hypothetical protein